MSNIKQTPAPESGAAPAAEQYGNAAALRKAAEEALQTLNHIFSVTDGRLHSVDFAKVDHVKEILKAALAVPARNCDLPDMEQRRDSICASFKTCGDCPDNLPAGLGNFSGNCIAHWLLATAKVSPDAAPSASTPKGGVE